LTHQREEVAMGNIRVQPDAVASTGQSISTAAGQLMAPARAAAGAAGSAAGAAGDGTLVASLANLQTIIGQAGQAAVAVGQVFGHQVALAAASYSETDNHVVPVPTVVHHELGAN
jgi:hypothetical protein